MMTPVNGERVRIVSGFAVVACDGALRVSRRGVGHLLVPGFPPVLVLNLDDNDVAVPGSIHLPLALNLVVQELRAALEIVVNELHGRVAALQILEVLAGLPAVEGE